MAAMSDLNPRISVIIPSHNRAHTLPRALDSVLAQTRSAEEIIVIDDGSDDDTPDLLAQHYPQVRVIQQTNQGVSAARNRGIEQATGNWIALLDSDDEWHPNKLQCQLEALAAAPAHRLIHSDEIWLRNGEQIKQMQKHGKQGGWIFQHCLPMCVISPSTTMIHRSVFDDIGYFDEDLPACEDYDLWLRLTAREPVLYIDQALITKYGGHADQLSARFWGMDRFRIRALERLLSSDTLRHEDLEAARQVMLKKASIYLNGARKRGRTEIITEYEALLQRWQTETEA